MDSEHGDQVDSSIEYSTGVLSPDVEDALDQMPRIRNLHEMERMLDKLKKDNFLLKLRIFYLEEEGAQAFKGDTQSLLQANVDWRVKVRTLEDQLEDQKEKFQNASSALQAMCLEKESTGNLQLKLAESDHRVGQSERKILELEQELADRKLQEAIVNTNRTEEDSGSDLEEEELITLQRHLEEKDELIKHLKQSLNHQNLSSDLRVAELEKAVENLKGGDNNKSHAHAVTKFSEEESPLSPGILSPNSLKADTLSPGSESDIEFSSRQNSARSSSRRKRRKCTSCQKLEMKLIEKNAEYEKLTANVLEKEKALQGLNNAFLQKSNDLGELEGKLLDQKTLLKSGLNHGHGDVVFDDDFSTGRGICGEMEGDNTLKNANKNSFLQQFLQKILEKNKDRMGKGIPPTDNELLQSLLQECSENLQLRTVEVEKLVETMTPLQEEQIQLQKRLHVAQEKVLRQQETIEELKRIEESSPQQQRFASGRVNDMQPLGKSSVNGSGSLIIDNDLPQGSKYSALSRRELTEIVSRLFTRLAEVDRSGSEEFLQLYHELNQMNAAQTVSATDASEADASSASISHREELGDVVSSGMMSFERERNSLYRRLLHAQLLKEKEGDYCNGGNSSRQFCLQNEILMDLSLLEHRINQIICDLQCENNFADGSHSNDKQLGQLGHIVDNLQFLKRQLLSSDKDNGEEHFKIDDTKVTIPRLEEELRRVKADEVELKALLESLRKELADRSQELNKFERNNFALQETINIAIYEKEKTETDKDAMCREFEKRLKSLNDLLLASERKSTADLEVLKEENEKYQRLQLEREIKNCEIEFRKRNEQMKESYEQRINALLANWEERQRNYEAQLLAANMTSQEKSISHFGIDKEKQVDQHSQILKDTETMLLQLLKEKDEELNEAVTMKQKEHQEELSEALASLDHYKSLCGSCEETLVSAQEELNNKQKEILLLKERTDEADREQAKIKENDDKWKQKIIILEKNSENLEQEYEKALKSTVSEIERKNQLIVQLEMTLHQFQDGNQKVSDDHQLLMKRFSKLLSKHESLKKEQEIARESSRVAASYLRKKMIATHEVLQKAHSKFLFNEQAADG